MTEKEDKTTKIILETERQDPHRQDPIEDRSSPQCIFLFFFFYCSICVFLDLP